MDLLDVDDVDDDDVDDDDVDDVDDDFNHVDDQHQHGDDKYNMAGQLWFLILHVWKRQEFGFWRLKRQTWFLILMFDQCNNYLSNFDVWNWKKHFSIFLSEKCKYGFGFDVWKM